MTDNMGEKISNTHWFYRLRCGCAFKSPIGINTLSIVQCGYCGKLTTFDTDPETPEQKERAFKHLLDALQKIQKEMNSK